MKNLILLAVQGAGKGTLAKALKEKYGYEHISTGDLLRERASVGDELGLKIKDLIDNGIYGIHLYTMNNPVRDYVQRIT